MVVVLEDDLVDSCKSGEDIAYVTYNCTMSVFTLSFEISAKQSVSTKGFFDEICLSVTLLFQLRS